MCFTRVYLQLWKLLTRFSFCILTLFLHWSNVICDPRGLLCFFHFSFFISFDFGWISWMSTQLVSFSRFDALRFSLSTASCSYVNLSFDPEMNFARAFKISIDARRRRWYGVVGSDQVLSKSVPNIFLLQFTCNLGSYSRGFPPCFDLVSLLEQCNVWPMWSPLFLLFHCNFTPRALVCGFTMVNFMLDVLMHCLEFKFHHTSEDLFMTTEVEYNWNFFKMWKFFISQFTSSTAISNS